MDLSPSGLSSLFVDSDVSSVKELGSVSEIARLLDSDVETGISPSSVSSHAARYGSNVLPDRPVRGFRAMLMDALGDQTLLVLIACAIFSLVFEILFASTEERSTAWIDGAAILAAVVVVSVVQASSNHRQELQFAALNRIKDTFRVGAIRGGEACTIQSTDLVVGDIVILDPGDRVPADGLLVEGSDVRVDQSVASGESEAVAKGEADPFLIGGTHVVEGRGKMLVLCVGLRSQNGRVFALLQEGQKPTPLQEKLEDLAADIGFVGMAAAALTFAALTIGWVVARVRLGWSWAACKDVLTYLIDALTIVVVAVPEGLPLAVTISLAYSMRRMMGDNNFVRRLSACETMGGATVICTDKTGTLTLNQMNVERVVVADADMAVEAVPRAAGSEFLDMLVRSVAVNTTALLLNDGSCMGSQTESALLRMVAKFGGDYEELRNSCRVVKTYAFDQNRKAMTTLVQNGSRYIGFSKGAPEWVIGRCTNYMDHSGKVYTLDKVAKESIVRTMDDHCKRAYRTLALAYRNWDNIPVSDTDAESEMTLIGFVSIRDSLRPSTKEAIASCQRAGIRVIMITGDNLVTAQAIAQDCGIAPSSASVMSGSEVRSMGQEKLSEAVADVCVVARSTPTDKHMIVSALQARGEVVAVTGDGTNDVAALSKADVGLAMGKCGTELAKEASDIVILDDDFKSIVSTVLWGRCIFNNVRRFLQFQLTANVVTLLISFISAVILNDTPFKAVQLLWVNLIMDSLGALALATSRPHPSLLNRPPPKRRASLISPFMIQNICEQTLFQITVVAALLIFHDGIEARSNHHYTLIFNVFVYCQMFNLVNARVVEWGDSVVAGITDNALFIAIMIGIGVVEFCLVQYGGHFFSCVPLTMKEQLLSLCIASLCVPFGLIMRRSPQSKFCRLITQWRRGMKKTARDRNSD